jgi:hypothetical protein
MRRSAVLSLPLQLAFPAGVINKDLTVWLDGASLALTMSLKNNMSWIKILFNQLVPYSNVMLSAAFLNFMPSVIRISDVLLSVTAPQTATATP